MRAPPAPRWSRLRRLSRRLAGEGGYTITELLTVLAILGIIVTSLATVFASASQAEVDMNLRFRAQQEARLALDRLRREGHCASAVALAGESAPASRITFTLPGHCRPGVDFQAFAVIPGGVSAAATSFTIGLTDGTFPPVPFTVRVNSEIMLVTAISGTTWSVQRGQLGTTVAAHGSPAYAIPGPYVVTWCTSAESAMRYVLRRIEGDASTCAGGRVQADHLTGGNVFTSLIPRSEARRATLGVSFTVDVDPANAMRVYRLQDDIVLRNTARSSS